MSTKTRAARGRPATKRDHERGLANEARVLEACLLRARPAWITSARRASRMEDRSGIDVVVESDVGALPIQVKSSNWGKKHFRRRPLIAVAIVVVRRADTPEMLLDKVLALLEQIRKERLQARRAMGIRVVVAAPPPVSTRV
jgi:hypothetical protein